MWKKNRYKFLIILTSLLIVLTGCAGNNADNNDSTKQSDKNEKQENNRVSSQEELDEVGEWYQDEDGKMTVIAVGTEDPTFTGKGVDYTIRNTMIVRMENLSEDLKEAIQFATGKESIPDQMNVLLTTMDKKNKLDEPIEFTGIHTAVLGTKQIDVILNDFAYNENEGSTMQGGVEMTDNIAIMLDETDVDQVRFIVSSAFRSSDFEDVDDEHEVVVNLKK
jgi:hypothetical protein